jgi:multiple sugar transport system substrate-binding protein
MPTPVRSRRPRSFVPLTALLAATGLVLTACGVSSSSDSAEGKTTTLTEMDYYNTEPLHSALPKQLKQCGDKAGVTVKRQVVPELRTKLMQLAGSRAIPDLVLLDNPDLQQLAATG